MLRLPLAETETQLTARISAGRELVDKDVAELNAELLANPQLSYAHARGAKPQGQEKVDALNRRVRQWRDYNRTWLTANLGGEAAEEYKVTSTHWSVGGVDDPRTNLRWLGEEVESEVAKLESIRERLPMWAPSDAAASSNVSTAPEVRGEGTGMVSVNPKRVMVIYGHDTEANDALFGWLRAIGLDPREWSQVIGASGSASPYIGQALDRAFRDAQAVVAFFTPDERVLARDASPKDSSAWRLQARPNVLIEAGMALTTHPERTVLVVLGAQELPTDLAGRHYVRLSRTSAAPLNDLASRLKQAGCDTDTTGGTWLDPGRFPDRNGIDPIPPD